MNKKTHLDMKLTDTIKIMSNWFGHPILFFIQLWTDYIHFCRKKTSLLASTLMPIWGCTKKKFIKRSCANNIVMLEMLLQVQIVFYLNPNKKKCVLCKALKVFVSCRHRSTKQVSCSGKTTLIDFHWGNTLFTTHAQPFP